MRNTGMAYFTKKEMDYMHAEAIKFLTTPFVKPKKVKKKKLKHFHHTPTIKPRLGGR